MTIFIAVVSIIAITLFANFFNKTKIFRSVCPICVGVFLTWVWMLTANFFGNNFDPMMIAILMGGSIVGITYTLEDEVNSRYSRQVFKTLFIPLGFFAVYELIFRDWIMLFVSVLLLLIVYFLFTSGSNLDRNGGARVRQIKDKLKDCC